MRTENKAESLQQKVQAVLAELLHGASIHYQHSSGAVRLIGENGESIRSYVDPETFLQLQAEQRITQTGKLRQGANGEILVYTADRTTTTVVPTARLARENAGRWLMSA